MKNKNKKNIKNWLVFFFLGGFLLKLLFNLKKERIGELKINFLDYVEKEEREVKKLIYKKESLKEFEEDSCSLFRQYFVPCEANQFHPKVLQTRSLVLVVVLLLLLKIAVVGYLFFVYPNKGYMAVPPRDEILTLINADRKTNKVLPLTLNSELNRAAQEKLNDMGANNYFAHNSPNGKKPWDWINRDIYHYTFAGENLAMDFTTSQSVHKALMESVSHRKNILNQRFENVGIALGTKIIDGEKTNILVELFGAHKEMNTQPKVAESKPATPVPAAGSNVKTLAVTKTVIQKNYLPVATGKVAKAPPKKEENKITKKIVEPVAIAPIVASDFIDEGKQEQMELALVSQVSARNISPEPNVVAAEKDNNSQFAKNIITGTQYFYLFVFLALVVLLCVNILIRLSVQHKPVLIETLFTIFIVIGFIATQAGYFDKVFDKVIIF